MVVIRSVGKMKKASQCTTGSKVRWLGSVVFPSRTDDSGGVVPETPSESNRGRCLKSSNIWASFVFRDAVDSWPQKKQWCLYLQPESFMLERKKSFLYVTPPRAAEGVGLIWIHDCLPMKGKITSDFSWSSTMSFILSYLHYEESNLVSKSSLFSLFGFVFKQAVTKWLMVVLSEFSYRKPPRGQRVLHHTVRVLEINSEIDSGVAIRIFVFLRLWVKTAHAEIERAPLPESIYKAVQGNTESPHGDQIRICFNRRRLRYQVTRLRLSLSLSLSP